MMKARQVTIDCNRAADRVGPEVKRFWPPPVESGRSCDLAASGRIALNTVVLGRGPDGWRRGPRFAGFDSVRRTVAPHRPMPFRWIGTAVTARGISVHQRGSAVCLVFGGLFGRPSGRPFPAVARGLSGGTMNAWLPFGIARRRRGGGATMAQTACPSLAVGLFEPWDAAVTHEQSDGPKRR